MLIAILYAVQVVTYLVAYFNLCVAHKHVWIMQIRWAYRLH